MAHDVDRLPDIRDGLTRIERAILVALEETRRERPGRRTRTALLYGRVAERVDIGPREFADTLARRVGRARGNT